MLFSVNEKVLCFHVGLLYQAKVIKAEKWTGEENLNKDVGPHYFVHYMGWHAKWDEWVPEARMLKLNEDNIQKQTALVESVKAAQQAKASGSLGVASKPSGRKSGGRESSEAHDGAPGERRKGKEARGTKRGREAVEQEEEYIKRPEIKLNVPDALKVRLVDDWEYVTKRGQLVPLPREPSVDKILSLYRTHFRSSKKEQKASRPPAVLDEVLDGLKVYFNKSLGNNLLYRFERAQYVQQRKEWKKTVKADPAPQSTKDDSEDEAEMEPSKVYGAEHLLRLFVNLPSLIAHTTMDAESIALLKEHLAEFLAFMVKEQANFFVKEYETPSSSYNRLSST